MGNVYRYGECDECRKVVDCEFTFIVHRDPTPITAMEERRFPAGKIAAHFCGYCGNFIDVMEKRELTENTCGCEHFDYQGWNYEDGDDRQWKEPEGWWGNKT